MRLAQELLRHTQIATTSDTYLHVDAAVAAEATETLAKAILPKPNFANCGRGPYCGRDD